MNPSDFKNPLIKPKSPRTLLNQLLAVLLCVSIFLLTLSVKDHALTITNEREPTIGSKNGECQCSQTLVSKFNEKGLCSDRANSRGQGQRVISYSFYGNPQSSYFKGIRLNLEGVEQFYPGYTMRLYHNLNESQSGFKELCDIFCQSNNLDLCNVRHIETYPNLDKHFGMIWRYLPLADPNVAEFHSRDLDSRISAREVAAVRDWQSSGKHFHVMRDNPAHYSEILGGMFGVHITADYFNKSSWIWNQMFVKSKDYPWTKGFDQNLLNRYAWPHAQDDVLVHDSYLCKTYPNPNNRPWPTKRIENETNNFVGSDGGIVNVQCPSFCRPTNHQDWTYC